MYLGFDTSNYTTSLALFDGEQIRQEKQLLTVSSGQRGLRQSDAVFQHTVNLPVLIEKIGYSNESIKAVGVSTRPQLYAVFSCGKMCCHSREQIHRR